MTDLATPTQLTGIAAADESGRSLLLGEVHRSVLCLLAELPTPPRRLRISALDVMVELHWPATDQLPYPPRSANATPPDHGPPPTPPAPAPMVALPAGHQITASTVGTFYRAPEPGAPPFVEIGDTVHAGQQLAILEAMKLMLPVEADIDGRIHEVLISDSQPVEFGEPLFLIEQG